MEINILTTEGRIRRTTFWLRWLLIFIINTSLQLLIQKLRTPGAFLFFGLIILTLTIFVIIQGVKRMHDVDKSGWNFIIPFYNLILSLQEGTRGPNAYGDDPKSDGLTPQMPYVPREKQIGDNKNADNFILLFLGFAAFSSLTSFAMQKLVDNWYSGNYKYAQILMNLIYAALAIVLATAIRNEKMKIAGIIISLIYFLYLAYSNITWGLA